MQSNSFGTLFKISTFGESHGKALGVIIDGCPAGLELDMQAIQAELDRRKPGQSKLVTPRKELDEFEILSGVFEGKTTGASIAMVVFNKDVKSKDYSNIKDLFRPGHADFTYYAKYRHRDYRGGGRSSARETVARVMAGAVAKQLLAKAGVSFKGGVVQVGNIKAKNYDWDQVNSNDVKFVDPSLVDEVTKAITDARKNRDSLGGLVEIQAHGVPVGLGEPVFGKIDGVIAGAMLTVPAVKGVEFGAGFDCVEMNGSIMNDQMTPEGFLSNNHGGVLGGITTGAPIVVRIALKPTSSIPQDLNTIDVDMKPAVSNTVGRHDPCVALRAAPIAESMLALVLVDYWLQDLAKQKARELFDPIEPISYGLKK